MAGPVVGRRTVGSTELEQVVTDWLRQLFGMGDGWFGMITDTASISTMYALAAARDRLAAAGLAPELHVLVGEAASTITAFADSHGCTQILIGPHGHSGLTGTLLG